MVFESELEEYFMAQMKILEDLYIKCGECGAEYRIDKDGLEYEAEYMGERGMGAEIEHDFYGEAQCEECENWMLYKVIGYEYPEGAYNSQDTDTSGCEFIRRPMIDIAWEYEFDYPLDVENYLCSLVSRTEQNLYDIANHPDSIYDLSSADFEDLVAEVFRRNGFEVVVTPRTRDGGKDIIASYNMSGIPCMLIIECKRYAEGRKVGVGVIRQIHGTQQAEHYGKAVVVTTSSFSRDAMRFANDIKDMVVLIDRNTLMEMLNRTMNRDEFGFFE